MSLLQFFEVVSCFDAAESDNPGVREAGALVRGAVDRGGGGEYRAQAGRLLPDQLGWYAVRWHRVVYQPPGGAGGFLDADGGGEAAGRRARLRALQGRVFFERSGERAYIGGRRGHRGHGPGPAVQPSATGERGNWPGV